MALSLFALACLAGAELGQLSSSVATRWPIPLLWPQAGLMVAALLLMGSRRITALIVAAAISAVSMIVIHGLPLIPSIGLCAIGALEACAAAAMLQRALRPRIAFRRIEDLWMLALVAVTVPMAGGVLAATMLNVTANEPSLRAAWLAWWLGDMLGMLTIVPAAFALMTIWPRLPRAIRLWRGGEAALVFAGAFAVAQAVFGDMLPLEVRLPIYLLPFILWACLRFDLGGASFVVFGATVIGLLHTVQGQGPLALLGEPATVAVFRAQGGGAMAALFFPMLAGVVAERKRVLRERDLLVSELQQALIEVKTLQGMIPICAWCHKIRDDEGFWQGVDTYLQERTEATFSHAICPTCSAQQHEAYGLTGTAVGGPEQVRPQA